MKKIIYIFISCVLVSEVLFSQANKKVAQGKSRGSKSVSKLGEVQISILDSCIKNKKRGSNGYVLVNRLKYSKYINVSKEMNRLLANKGNYVNFSREIRVKNRSLDSMVSQIRKKGYFNSRLKGKASNKNSFLFILRDFKVDYRSDVSDYRIVLSVIDVKKKKVLCNVNTNIDLKRGTVMSGKAMRKSQAKPKYIEKIVKVEKIVEVDRARNPKKDNLFSVMTYFSDNILDVGFYRLFEEKHGDAKIYNFGLTFEYDKHIYDSLYLGFELTAGYLYTDIVNDSLFSQDFIRRLVIGVNAKPTYIMTLSEEYSIDFFMGLRLGYLRLLEYNSFMYGGFLGFNFGYFKIEAAYPFPLISVGVTF